MIRNGGPAPHTGSESTTGNLRRVKCKNCDAEVAANALYCWSCGQPLRALLDERRVVTVLFADLVGFTTLSETLDPEAVRRLVDAAFERLVDDVTSFGGRVDKIVGDAIVALFGAPIAHEDDAERAVRAGLRMQGSLASYATESGVAVRMRIGVNTGEVLVGALRAGGDYTAMGDVVNTASRLQTSAEPGDVLVGESTYRITAEAFRYESRGSMFARGREQPINVWVARDVTRPPGQRRGRDRSPLVGRDGELVVMTETVEISRRRGRGLVLLLLGEAGVGKTRLANELCDRVAEQGAIVLTGRCVPYGESNPWFPIAECIRSGVGIDPDAPLDETRAAVAREVQARIPDRDDAARVTNGLLHMLGFEGPLRGLGPANARTEATDSLRTFMEASVRHHPVLIRLADLHWADELVLGLIDDLADHLARSSFVLVATARRGLTRRWTPRGGRYNLSVVNLDPLDRTAAESLLNSLAPEASSELRAELLDRSGGNPLYLEELVTLISDRGDAPTQLPDTLRGLIAARIDGLSVDEQLTLEDAAVWGSSGHLKALERLAEHTQRGTDVPAVVASLREKEVLELVDEHWTFRSDLIREVAYQRLTKHDRLLRHAGIARYLDNAMGSRFADDASVDAVARHYQEAARLSIELGRPDDEPDDLVERATTWLGEAIRRAEQSAAWVAAARLCGHGLDLAGTDGPKRLHLLLTRAHARSELWDFAEARADAMAALELALESQDGTSAARAHLVLGDIASRDGKADVAAGHLDEAVTRFDDLGDLHGRAEALRLSGMNALFAGDHQRADVQVTAALKDFRAEGHRGGAAWALQNLAWISFTSGDIDRSEQYLEDALHAFDDLGDASGRAWVDGLLAFVRFNQGRNIEARDLSTRILRESERRGDRWGQSMMLTLMASMELWDGHTERAVRLIRRGTEILRSLGDFGGLEQAVALSGRALVMTGSVAEGLDALAEARQLGRGPISIGGVSQISAFAQLGRPLDPESVTHALAALGEATAANFSDAWAAVAHVLAGLGDLDGAEAVLAGMTASADPSRPAKRSVDALVHAARGRLDEAAAALDDVSGDRRATYLDLLYARVAVALGRRDPSRLEPSVEEIAATGDKVSAAILASARRFLVASQPAWPDPELLWSELGVEPAGWNAIFDAIVAGAN